MVETKYLYEGELTKAFEDLAEQEGRTRLKELKVGTDAIDKAADIDKLKEAIEATHRKDLLTFALAKKLN